MNDYKFQGIERRGDRLVAAFHHKTVFDEVYRHGEYVPVPRDTSVFDLSSLRQRITNLSEAGVDTSEEEKAEWELRRGIDKDTND